MENIRSSFWGYNKADVKNLIFEKDQIIDSQQKDIDYLRAQNKKTMQEGAKDANSLDMASKQSDKATTPAPNAATHTNKATTSAQSDKTEMPKPNNSNRYLNLEQERLNEHIEPQI